MVVLNIFLSTLCTILSISCMILLIRNELVGRFRSKLIDKIFTGDTWQQKHKIYANGPSYNKMLLSLKRLRLESFYTPEQIEIINKQ